MNEKNDSPITFTIDEVFSHLEHDPEYQAERRRQKPYYDLVIQIINLRTTLGLTQKKLAEKAKTFQSRISKIEAAEHDIRFSTLIEIADALDADVSVDLIPRHPGQAMAKELFSQVKNFGGIDYIDAPVDQPGISLCIEGTMK